MAVTRNISRVGSKLGMAIVLGLALAACATGSGGGVGDDYQEGPDAKVDAPNSTPIDAPGNPVDARVDAPVSTIDATDAPGLPTDGPITGACTSHAQCGTGMCCFGMLMCVPGDPLPLPPPFDCLPS